MAVPLGHDRRRSPPPGSSDRVSMPSAVTSVPASPTTVPPVARARSSRDSRIGSDPRSCRRTRPMILALSGVVDAMPEERHQRGGHHVLARLADGGVDLVVREPRSDLDVGCHIAIAECLPNARLCSTARASGDDVELRACPACCRPRGEAMPASTPPDRRRRRCGTSSPPTRPLRPERGCRRSCRAARCTAPKRGGCAPARRIPHQWRRGGEERAGGVSEKHGPGRVDVIGTRVAVEVPDGGGATSSSAAGYIPSVGPEPRSSTNR